MFQSIALRHIALITTSKPFWVGEGGWWAAQQFPDGTIIVTSPTGKTYPTKPFSALLFPGWNITTTASPPTGTPPSRAPGFEAMMTKRKRTRRQDHAYRIAAERALNAALIAATRARVAPNASDNDPPPF